MEYGYFKKRDGNFRDRNDRNDRGDRNDRNDRNDRDRGSNSGGGYGDRGGFRDRGNNSGGGYGGGGGGFQRGGGGGGFRDRGNNFGDRDNRRFDRDRERGDAEESVFSKKVRAGKRRTYFLDVRKTKGEDFFITITESTKREDGFGYRRHKIFLYKEDFNRFVASLNEVVDHVKNDLMPDFDYEEFDRRQAEWESQNRDEEEEEDRQDDSKNVKNDAEDDVNW
ncbi:MAG: DUF3276 family protein [Bacteroidota bacterium]|nr:PUR family DNA/RNA-binding protein [Saprospiraceae bacterium]